MGTAWTEFEGTTPAELRDAIERRATTPGGRRWTLKEHLDGAVQQQYRSMVRDPAKRVWRRYVKGGVRPPERKVPPSEGRD